MKFKHALGSLYHSQGLVHMELTRLKSRFQEFEEGKNHHLLFKNADPSEAAIREVRKELLLRISECKTSLNEIEAEITELEKLS